MMVFRIHVLYNYYILSMKVFTVSMNWSHLIISYKSMCLYLYAHIDNKNARSHLLTMYLYLIVRSELSNAHVTST